MINGAHVIILSKQPEADRAFFRDVLGLRHVDVGGGWLIFALPPSEVAVHPSGEESAHEFYLMCEDVNALVTELTERGIRCGPVEDQGWGLLTSLTLPGGGTLGAYEPRHARPTGDAPSRGASRRPVAKKSAPKRAPEKAKAKSSSKAAPRERAPKKPAPKKAPKRPAPKKAPKKPAPKKPAPKKPAPREPAPREPAPRKPAPKNAAKQPIGRRRR
jgi:catechol 2,3-dioxygenase-like lactoylglutathione lyase family enzyme